MFTIYKSSCNHPFPSQTYFISLSLTILRKIKMANHLLVIASLLVIACAMVTAFEPSPLQDFCVADPTSSGQDLTNL
jgi:hypothetical protein